jgi:hypothetical protein
MAVRIFVTTNVAIRKELPANVRISSGSTSSTNTEKGIGVSYNKDNKSIVISNNDGEALYQQALDKLTKLRYVASINNVAPYSDGTFFILGSECTSVSSILAEDYSLKSGITVVDMCPSCSNCTTYVNTLKQIESYKILLNRIKDFNLYTRDIAGIREEYLVNKQLELQKSCEADLKEDPALDKLLDTVLSGDRLFKQYIATVHMWNYAVNMTGAHTQLAVAPEDPSGFVVQSMRALPSCDGELLVSVDIRVHGPATCNDDPVSIYVPEPMIGFIPDGSATPVPELILEHTSVTDKRLYTPETRISGAGSLCITARFLPFVAINLTYDGNPISVDDFISEIITQEQPSVEEDGFTITSKINKFSIEHEAVEIIEPTLDDYNNSRRYPSLIASTDPLRYAVDIMWTITGVFKDDTGTPYYDEKVIADTYYFDCRPLRKCVSNIWKDVESFVTNENKPQEDDESESTP